MEKELISKDFLESNPFIPQDTDSFIARMEWAILSLASPQRAMTSCESTDVKISSFDGAVMLHDKGDDTISKEMLFWLTSENRVGSFGNVNVKILNFSDTDGIILLKSRRVEPKEYRWKKFTGLDIYEITQAVFVSNETWYSGREWVEVLPLKKNVGCISSVVRPVPKRPNTELWRVHEETVIQLNKNFMIMNAMNLCNYYEWFAYIREPGGIGFKIPIHPETTKQLDSGKTPTGRRMPSLHLVQEHYRKIENPNYDPEYREVLVAQHFRGQTKHTYRGCEFHVIPSLYDQSRSKTKKKFIKH